MEMDERKRNQAWLEHQFTVDLLHVNPDGEEEAHHYVIALSANGSLRERPKVRIGFSDTLVGATIAHYPDHGDGYAIQPETIQRPAGVTQSEAIAIVKAIFEDSGRGAAVDDDWVWRPILLDDFVAKIFSWPRYSQIADLLHAEVENRNAQVLGKEK